VIRKLQIASPRNEKGLLLVRPSEEEYFGQELQRSSGTTKAGAFALAKTQHFAMELYESRIASLERFVSMCVMFRQIGSRVQCFFEKVSLGFLGYRMDRAHSIMRIVTTASPVSGADVRERMEALQVRTRIQNALRVIESAWCKYQKAEVKRWKLERNNTPVALMNVGSESVPDTPDDSMLPTATSSTERKSIPNQIKGRRTSMGLPTMMRNRNSIRLGGRPPASLQMARSLNSSSIPVSRRRSCAPLSLANLLAINQATPYLEDRGELGTKPEDELKGGGRFA
jgi:hypothetical protein